MFNLCQKPLECGLAYICDSLLSGGEENKIGFLYYCQKSIDDSKFIQYIQVLTLVVYLLFILLTLLLTVFDEGWGASSTIFWVVLGGFCKELKICEMGHKNSDSIRHIILVLVLIFSFGKIFGRAQFLGS